MRKNYQKSLFLRYFSVSSSMILIGITLVGVLFAGFSIKYFRESKKKQLTVNAEQAAALTLADMSNYGYRKISYNTLLNDYRIISSTTGSIIFLTDTDGQTLICTEGETCNHHTYTISDDVMEKAVAGNFFEAGTLGGIYETSYYTVGTPVVYDGTVMAVIFVSADASELWQYVLDIIDIYFVCAIIAIFVSSVVIYFVTQSQIKPLAMMVSATKSFAEGDFSAHIPVTGSDEIAQLATAFNNMAMSLADLESVRRSFIANVSHELKTPMMTIGGFIDGILDGTIPEEKQHDYLVLVSEEVRRLSRMVKAMLGIARIEAGETQIVPSVFDINELICRSVFSFEQKIEERHLEIEGLDVEPVYVYADNDLIHQVVFNLIDNAVKFTNDAGTISFSYKQEKDRVFIAVRNTGEGIPQHEIPRLFDRFYKSDKSRSQDKSGVGLGLYIVQTLVKLHKGDLIVSSVEGEYVEFAFSLDAADPKAVKELKKHRSAETS